LAALEDGKFAIAFSSGLGGLSGILSMLKTGDSILGTAHVYEGSYRVINLVFINYGILFKSILS